MIFYYPVFWPLVWWSIAKSMFIREEQLPLPLPEPPQSSVPTVKPKRKRK